MSKTILIMSDSHGFDKAINRVLSEERYDIAVFAGDYTTDLTYMKEHFDYFVDGNNDYGHKDIQEFKVENVRFVLVHSHTMFSFNKDTYFNRMREFGREHKADVVIYGHTHLENINNDELPILVNPGSIALPRNIEQKPSYIIATVDNREINFKIKYM